MSEPREGERKILRVVEGYALPDGWRVVQILQTETQLWTPGTEPTYIYTVEAERLRGAG